MSHDRTAISTLRACKRIKQERGIELTFSGNSGHLEGVASPASPYPNCTWTLSPDGLRGTVTVEAKQLTVTPSKTHPKVERGSIVLWQRYETTTSDGLYASISACVNKLEQQIRRRNKSKMALGSKISSADGSESLKDVPSKPRVLCVDDHEDTRELIEAVLTGNDYQVDFASSAISALTMVQSHRFALFMIHYWQRGVTGIELCKALREIDSVTPILFYSAAAYENDREEALRFGAQAYLMKPVDPNLLVAEVARLLARAR
jgi:CheY-like chemotaxis protein